MAATVPFVARIRRDGAIQGGGLVIANDLVVTCTHIVRSETANLQVDFPGASQSRPSVATVIGWKPLESAERSGAVRDVCVLRLAERIEGFVPPVVAITPDLTGHPFRTIGFPAGYDGGIEATGEIQQLLPTGWMQLDAVRQPGHAVAPGFSGAPVLDARLGAFVGVVAESDAAPTKTGTMIPLDVFARAFPIVALAFVENLVTHWRDWERSRRADIELRAALSPRSLHVSTALDSLWREFAGRWPWHEAVRKQLHAFANASRAIDDLPVRLRDAATAFDNVACDASYPELLSQLRNAIPRTLLADIRPLVRAEDEKERRSGAQGTFNRRRARLHDMSRAAFLLTRHAAEPRFGRCLLVAGRFGSGKTHFCASLLDGDPDNLRLHVPVELPASDAVEDAIGTAVRSASRVAWPTLGDFDAMVRLLASSSERSLEVYVELDDVHVPLRRNPAVLPALTRFIDEHTSMHWLSYILTIQDAQWDCVAARTDFWLRQNALGPDPEAEPETERTLSHAGGWLFLDDLNEDTLTGHTILRNALGWAISPETAVSRRVLSHPLTAVILVELGEHARSGAAAASLNFPEFVEHFWQHRKATLDPAPLTLAALDEAIALIAQLVSDLGNSPALRDVLCRVEDRSRDLFGARWTSERMQDAVDAISNASLVRTEMENRDDPASRRLLLLVEAFWCHRLAIVIMRDLREFTNPKKMGRAVRSWFAERQLAGLAEGTLEFLLLLLDRRDAAPLLHAGDEPPDQATAVASIAFAGNGLSPAAPWLAGARLGAKRQRSFLAAGLQNIAQASDLRTTFSFLYFLRSATLPPRKRLESAAHAFPAIRQHGLGSYFLYFFERTLEDFESARELAAALPALRGVEVIGVTPLLAELAAIRLRALCGSDELLDILIDDYLRPLSSGVATEPRREAPWRRFFFREWLLHEVLTDLAHHFHIDLYARLVERRWYEGSRIGIRLPVPLEMEREANIAIGSRYRRPLDAKERERFVQELRTIVEEGKPRDRAAAFYIIRHTEPPAGNDRVIVRQELRPLLALLAADPSLLSRVGERAAIFEANVEGFVWRAGPRKRPKFTPPGPPSA